MTSVRAVRRGPDGERGAFIVLWALLVVAILIMVAVVIDLGNARAVRRSDQSIADFAALAAGENLGNNVPAARADALNYIQANVPGLSSGAGSPCNQTGSGGLPFPTTCNDLTTGPQDFPATGSSPYTITFRFPVSDTDIANPRFSSSKDGTPCSRFKVTMAKTDASFFAGVLGEKSRTTQASAVMLSTPGGGDQVPALWLLDPEGCTALDASGGSTTTVGTASIPGLITIDSDGQGSSCSNNKVTMDASGSGTSIRAIPASGTPAGSINLFAMPVGGASCTQNACDPADVPSLVSPQPTHGKRATRAPIDYLYNCKATGVAVSGYPTGVASPPSLSPYPNYHPNLPSFPGVPIDNCPNASLVPPYMDTLTGTAFSGSVGSTAGTAPLHGSWSRWTSSFSCTPGALPPLSGNWWIDCGASGLKLGSGNSVTITNGNVVLDGGITLTGSGSFTISQGAPVTNTACEGTFNGTTGAITVAPVLDSTCLNYTDLNQGFLYIRGGDLNPNGGTFSMAHTAVIQTGGGLLKATSGAPVTWSAPTFGPFKKLAYWNEAPGTYTLNGGGNMNLTGAFFTPEATPFKLTGGGGSSLLSAQFISNQLSISGSGSLNLVPSTSTNIPLLKGTPALIR